MAEITLTPKSPLDGAAVSIAACDLREVTDLALTSLAVPQGDDKGFAKSLKAHFGVARPDARMSTVNGDVRAVATAPDQVLVLHPFDLQAHALKDAYLTDQTGNWCILSLEGPNALDALRRICPIDLEEPVFPEGSYARTTMEHMGAAVIRTGPQSFLLLSASSSAKSFWHAVETSLKNL